MQPNDATQDDPIASNPSAFSWNLNWHPSTTPLHQEPVLSGPFPRSSGPLPYAQPHPTVPTRPGFLRRKVSKWWLLLTLLLGVGLGVGLGVIGAPNIQDWLSRIQASIMSTSAKGSTPAQTPSTLLPTSSPEPTLTATPQEPTWTTLQRFTGSGSTNTASVTVPKSWRIAWQCDPSSSSAGQYELTIILHTTDGKSVSTTLSTTCKASNTSGTDSQYQAGTFYLQVISAADWIIQVQVLKPAGG